MFTANETFTSITVENFEIPKFIRCVKISINVKDLVFKFFWNSSNWSFYNWGFHIEKYEKIEKTPNVLRGPITLRKTNNMVVK